MAIDLSRADAVMAKDLCDLRDRHFRAIKRDTEVSPFFMPYTEYINYHVFFGTKSACACDGNLKLNLVDPA